MRRTALTGPILPWGDSYGIRFKKADVERVGLKPGQEVTIIIDAHGGRVDLSHLPTFRSGAHDTAERHDAFLGAARQSDL